MPNDSATRSAFDLHEQPVNCGSLAQEVVWALDGSLRSELTIHVEHLLAARRSQWASPTKAKSRNLIKRRKQTACHYVDHAFSWVVAALQDDAMKGQRILLRLLSTAPHRVLGVDKTSRLLRLVCHLMISREGRAMERFINQIAEDRKIIDAITDNITAYIARKRIPVIREKIDRLAQNTPVHKPSHSLEYLQISLEHLSDCFSEPRLHHLFWARQQDFRVCDTNRRLVIAYCWRMARNKIVDGVRKWKSEANQSEKPLESQKVQIKSEAQLNREAANKVLVGLRAFFSARPNLRQALHSPDFSLAQITNCTVAGRTDELLLIFVNDIAAMHFRSGNPDRHWGIFWARIVHGMSREEAGNVSGRDVQWVRKRENELRETVMKTINAIRARRDGLSSES